MVTYTQQKHNYILLTYRCSDVSVSFIEKSILSLLIHSAIFVQHQVSHVHENITGLCILHWLDCLSLRVISTVFLYFYKSLYLIGKSLILGSFFRLALAILESLLFHTHFRISLSSFSENSVQILTRIALNLQLYLGRTDIFLVLNLIIPECVYLSHLIQPSLPFCKVLIFFSINILDILHFI